MDEADMFWSRVKQLIKKRNTTQARVAEACGFHLETFHGWIYKGVFPTVLGAYYIARVLGVSVEYLMAGKNKHEEEIESQLKNIRALLDKASSGLDELI
ncbi:helix-turn-helix domain-containing protein [Leadbettera azotonutricia]|uniref:Putative transcriptional regulator n=1 Tax=Leadbettera azotonutricia (strain ATCC BAA-888 / DSM 13862 / ZAS-9) TaxID=545695 RepID=F5Y7V6_LEAAZ|nr:helix-turn-helix transcriptional regulator [Leadbettera azotonutricia]AEF82830.1 putative transcriptional regulator [Leadbettera azotonutricia ZAS-9]